MVILWQNCHGNQGGGWKSRVRDGSETELKKGSTTEADTEIEAEANTITESLLLT